MRIRRVRFTVRRMMVAAAIVGILVWAIRLQQIAAYYRARANNAAVGERFCRSVLSKGDPNPETWRMRADYFSTMRQRCDRIARYPWLIPEPDPPEPE